MTYLIAQVKAHNGINKFLDLEQVDANVGVLAAMGTDRGDKPHEDLVEANKDVFKQLSEGKAVYVYDLDDLRACFLKVVDHELVVAAYHFSPGYNSFDVKRTDGFVARNLTDLKELDALMGFVSPEKDCDKEAKKAKAEEDKPVQSYSWDWASMANAYADEEARVKAAKAAEAGGNDNSVTDVESRPASSNAEQTSTPAQSQMANAFSRAAETSASTPRRGARR